MKYELRQMRDPRERRDRQLLLDRRPDRFCPGRAMYHATKHGVIGLTKKRGARICRARQSVSTPVCPGTIETPMVAENAGQGT